MRPRHLPDAQKQVAEVVIPKVVATGGETNETTAPLLAPLKPMLKPMPTHGANNGATLPPVGLLSSRPKPLSLAAPSTPVAAPTLLKTVLTLTT